MADIARHVSEVERERQQLERRARKIALSYLLYRRLHGGDEMGDTDVAGQWRGEVNGLIAAGLFVRFGGVFEGFVPARTLSPDERYELDDFGLAMVGTRSGHRFRLGDQVDVFVDKVDRANGRVDLRRVGTAGGQSDPRGPRPRGKRPPAKPAPRRGRRGRR